MHQSPTPDEPGGFTDEKMGTLHQGMPSITIPANNPYLVSGDPGQPWPAWQGAGIGDQFVMVDMQTRFNAVLQVSGVVNLPYHQGVLVAAAGAVTTYDATTFVTQPVLDYVVSGATVTLPPGYPPGTNYIVEFQASPTYVAFRKAGGDPHIRPAGGGQISEPRRFRLQMLDLWLRENAPGTQSYAAPLGNY